MWRLVNGFDELTDITYHRHVQDATVRVAFNRPEVRNAFRPHTVDELYRVLDHARMSPDVGVVLLTGNGPSPKTVAGPSAPVGTNASGDAVAISTQAETPQTPLTSRGRAGCTSSRCNG
ncbi:enoyl-CoA hydratase/isomerase family protein [Mycobacterium ulcerans str. Harvey]|uniref:Enoyl-CoA hydratase/isomerase family protein n=1 Tax=Mycobacterium ulcerans str. Harvey TaxID=1299332 RepID=A0ABP3APT2_MYCUL|nr:enoyl-CoA hydratase/isomerase family protein [Mycobacterium ulcerans str. Harvey]